MLTLKCLLFVAAASGAFAMDCSFVGSNRFEDKLLHSCPRPLQSSSYSYCCPTADGSFECCDFAQFISTPPFDSLVVVGLVIFLLVFGCCLFGCCMCCWLGVCRNRSRGRVLYQANAQGF